MATKQPPLEVKFADQTVMLNAAVKIKDNATGNTVTRPRAWVVSAIQKKFNNSYGEFIANYQSNGPRGVNKSAGSMEAPPTAGNQPIPAGAKADIIKKPILVSFADGVVELPDPVQVKDNLTGDILTRSRQLVIRATKTKFNNEYQRFCREYTAGKRNVIVDVTTDPVTGEPVVHISTPQPVAKAPSSATTDIEEDHNNLSSDELKQKYKGYYLINLCELKHAVDIIAELQPKAELNELPFKGQQKLISAIQKRTHHREILKRRFKIETPDFDDIATMG